MDLNFLVWYSLSFTAFTFFIIKSLKKLLIYFFNFNYLAKLINFFIIFRIKNSYFIMKSRIKQFLSS
jgi:hypothetical protein